MNKYILSIFLFLTANAIIAQDVNGLVTSENREVVPYASIYLKNKHIGTSANTNGQFRLPIDFLKETNDTLVFSAVGYVSQNIPIVQFAKNVSAKDTIIVLTTNYLPLPKTTIAP